MDTDNLTLIQVSPFTRINERWKISDPGLAKIFDQSDPATKFVNFDDTYSLHMADVELYQQSFLHVVTETIFHYPHNANGEKTWKPIANFRPFVILGVPGSLSDLRRLGFMTFDRWWDESYDDIQDPSQRLLAVADIIKWVCFQKLEELQILLKEMKPVLEHNHRYYHETMQQQQTLLFDEACKKNLLPRQLGKL